MTPRHILYLTYDGLSDPLGRSQILPYIIGLSGHNYRFTIISFEKAHRFASQHRELRLLCEEHKITWVPLTYHKSPPILSTLFDIWLLWRKTKEIHKSEGVSIIHCRSYITALIGLRAHRKWSVKFVFDMRGFWADERVEGGLWSLSDPLFRYVYKFFKQKEKQFLQEADHIISLTRNAKKEIELWNIVQSPITVIPTCVDLELFDPSKIRNQDQNELREKLGVKESDFLLLYIGSWGTWYLTDEMLNFFYDLKKLRSQAKFLIVSGDKIELKNFSPKKDIVITSAPRHLVPLYISLANLSVCFIKTSFSKKASSATKIGEILAMNGLVVTNTGWGDIDDAGLYGQCLILSDVSTELSKDYFDQLTAPAYPAIRKKKFPDQLSLDWGVKTYLSIYDQVLSRVN